MQREKAAESFFDQDLKEAVSEVRRNEYRRATEAVRDPVSLKVIEIKVRTDFNLTQDDRLQLLGDIERLAAQGLDGEAAVGIFRGDGQRTAPKQ